ncbi:MAG: TetR/AcrR family transcriptional regulator C-terminal domain-containing protein [Eubacteriales bacterium]|nr:TetR/AcrR family transcriptional regulator C-terminal domain-containing protein [Eubacteriales bacterium]
MSQTTDRRITKSKKAIQSAFLEMLLDVGFDAITVKDMAEKADISRKTFYLHYLDKYDLLNEIVDEMIRELTELCEKKKDKGFVEGTVLWFYYFEDQKPFFQALFSTESTITFRHRLLDFIMEQLNNKLEGVSDEKNTEVLRKFMAMAVLGVLESYVLNQFHVGIEEIAQQVGELLEQIIVQVQSK